MADFFWGALPNPEKKFIYPERVTALFKRDPFPRYHDSSTWMNKGGQQAMVPALFQIAQVIPS